MKNRFKGTVKGFFGWFANFFGGTFAELGRSVRNVGQSPLPCSITMAIMLSRIAAMVMFVFSFVIFVLNGGYMEQIRIIGGGLVQWSQAFTSGTLSNYFGGFALVAWTIVLGLSFFAIHIVYIIKEQGFKRILMVFLMVIVLAALVLYLLFVGGALGELFGPVNGFESLWQNITGSGLQGFALPIYLVVLVVTLFAASVLAVKSTLKDQMRQWLSSVISVYLGLPLLLWFSQNLLALAAMVIFLALFGGILYLLFSVLVSKIGDSGGSGDESDDSKRSSADGLSADGYESAAVSGGRRGRAARPAAIPAARPAARPATMGSHAPKPGQRVVEVEPGARLWKIKSATGDYIQSETGVGATSEVCTAAEFDKGRVLIKQGEEIVSAIPWKPKK